MLQNNVGPRQILGAGRLEQRLVELSTLKLAHLAERRVADDSLRRRLSSTLAITTWSG